LARVAAFDPTPQASELPAWPHLTSRLERAPGLTIDKLHISSPSTVRYQPGAVICRRVRGVFPERHEVRYYIVEQDHAQANRASTSTFWVDIVRRRERYEQTRSVEV
jgi:hypothetical protein